VSSPFDRLMADFPHGDIEGFRQGCKAGDCPATPFKCRDLASRYRSDATFRRIYDTGLRGEELATAVAIASGASPAPALEQQAKKAAAPKKRKEVLAGKALQLDETTPATTSAPEPSPAPKSGPRRGRAADQAINVELLERHAAGESLESLGEWLGCKPDSVYRRINRVRARERAEQRDTAAEPTPMAPGGIVPVQAPEELRSLEEQLAEALGVELSSDSEPGDSEPASEQESEAAATAEPAPETQETWLDSSIWDGYLGEDLKKLRSAPMQVVPNLPEQSPFAAALQSLAEFIASIRDFDPDVEVSISISLESAGATDRSSESAE